jgi:hypothetical protein
MLARARNVNMKITDDGAEADLSLLAVAASR